MGGRCSPRLPPPLLYLTRVSEDGRGPLFWAYEYERYDMVKLLLDKGADAAAVDAKGNTPVRSWAAAEIFQYTFGAGVSLLVNKPARLLATSKRWASWGRTSALARPRRRPLWKRARTKKTSMKTTRSKHGKSGEEWREAVPETYSKCAHACCPGHKNSKWRLRPRPSCVLQSFCRAESEESPVIREHY